MKGTMRWRSGSWTLQVYAGRTLDGKPKFVTRTVKAPNTRAGRKFADTELARLVIETETGKTVTAVTVAELLGRWEAQRRNRSPKTVAENHRVIATKIVPRIGNLAAHKVTGGTLRGLYDELRTSGRQDGGPLAESGVWKVHAILHAAYEWAIRDGLLHDNPADRVQAPSQKSGPGKLLTPEEVAAALRCASQSAAMLAFVSLVATTGARPQSVCAVEWADIGDDEILYRRRVIGVKGSPVMEGSKTGRVIRVALDQPTRDALAAWGMVVGEHGPLSGFVFSDDLGVTPWNPNGVLRRFRRMGGQVTFRQLRHWMVSTLLAEGVDVRTTAGRAGHTPAVTLGVYGHMLPAADRDAASRIRAVIQDA